MDDALKKALDFAKYRQTYSIQQKVLKENINARLTYGYNGGIFKINRELIVFVQMLLDQGRSDNVPLLDLNTRPILIDDLGKFRDEIFDRYFSSTLEYYEEYEALKKKRSVEKLLEYE
jgi:hypothetical protein